MQSTVDSSHIVVHGDQLIAEGTLSHCRDAAQASGLKASIYRNEAFRGFTKWVKTEYAKNGILYDNRGCPIYNGGKVFKALA